MSEDLLATENENFKTGCDFFEKKDYVSALHFFEKSSLDGLNNSCQVHLKKAYCHFQLLNYAEAISEYSKVININPNLPPAFINRGNAKTKLGDLSGAIGDYNLAIKLDPSNNLVYFNRAISFLEINEPEKAISDFSVWIQNNPNDPEGYKGRGMAFYNSGNHPNAISDFSMAIKKGCSDNQIYKMRSTSFAMVGEKNKAEADLATANFLKTSDKKPNFLKLSYLKIIAIIAFSVFLGLSIAVFIFFPERLPSGIGFNLLPLDVYSRKSLIGEGRVIFIKNSSQKSLKNLSIYLSSKSRNLEKSLFRESLEPEGFFEIGWVQGWKQETGDTLTIKCPGYLPGFYNFDDLKNP